MLHKVVIDMEINMSGFELSLDTASEHHLSHNLSFELCTKVNIDLVSIVLEKTGVNLTEVDRNSQTAVHLAWCSTCASIRQIRR